MECGAGYNWRMKDIGVSCAKDSCGRRVEEASNKQIITASLFLRFCRNFVPYDKNHTVIWESGTYVDYGQQVRCLRMNERGDLEIIVTCDEARNPEPLWSSSTSEKYGAEAVGAHLEIDWEHHLLKIISKGGRVLGESG